MGILSDIRNFFMPGKAPERPADHENPGRNGLCWCGSGKKYKKCHLEEDQKRLSRKMAATCTRST
ncbi:MAG: SEC-C metal-binding domain-containing protein [Nitrospiraceae bacterium]|nr:SEC-C metal-binding domain-containing protein [Nitrospiraceae bacterium]